jgi:acid phosphatase (class A)
MTWSARFGCVGAAVLICAAAPGEDAPPRGYLATPALDLIDFIDPPPSSDSAQAIDEAAAYRASVGGVGSPSWSRAIADRAERPSEMVGRMSCATYRDITPMSAPAMLAMIVRAQADLALPLRALKERYKRPRPYAADAVDAPLCEPVPPERRSPGSPSYPSGHAAEAALTGYLLASLLPLRAAEILQRAKQYGDSRVVCRVHYPSDVRAGQSLAAAVFTRLQGETQFRRDAAKARAELSRLPERSGQAGCPG